MKKLFCLLAFAFSAAFATQTVAVLPSDGVLSNDENELLTDKMREAALKVLPVSKFTLLKQDVVVKRLGGMETYIKECSETSCIVSLGKKAQVDYVAQCRVGNLGSKLRITVELYEVSTGGLLGMFSDVSEDFDKLPSLMDKHVPDVFMNITAPRQEASAAPVTPVADTTAPPSAEKKDSTGLESATALEKAIEAELGSKAPEKIDPQVKTEESRILSLSKSFWVALALDIAGAVLITYGYLKDKEVVDMHDEYRSLGEQSQNSDFGDAWQKIDDAQTMRNTSYIVGGTFLAAGVGVHIWF
ncbi:MAG: hypothetical protein LBQ76_07820 [Candidatus Fibromonas sp.]|nr:hypothetical protein [Candidatus Fibromonas sp.]